MQNLGTYAILAFLCVMAGAGVLGAVGVFDTSSDDPVLADVEARSAVPEPLRIGSEWMVTHHDMDIDLETDGPRITGGTLIWVEYGFNAGERDVWSAWIPYERNKEVWAQRLLYCYEQVKTGYDLPQCAR